jgi:hypothetical protein
MAGKRKISLVQADVDGTIVTEEKILTDRARDAAARVAREAIDLMRARGFGTLVYSGNDWLITKAVAPHVAREAWTVKFSRKSCPTFGRTCSKSPSVDVSDDLDKVQRCKTRRRRHSASARPPTRRNPSKAHGQYDWAH